MQSSGCIGNLSKSESLQDSKLKGSLRKRSRNSSIGNRRRWQGLEAMENNISISVSLEGNISSIPNSIINDSKMSTDNCLDTSFINHGMTLFCDLSILSCSV
jgi:cytoskeletal protein CcmA (bactofilin family)